MSIFSYHLLNVPYGLLLKALCSPLHMKGLPGLVHMERMSVMTLGAPLFSSSRILLRKMALFAQWEDEEALEHFLQNDQWGKVFTKGWHCRLLLTRKWGTISGFEIPDELPDDDMSDAPVVAVTLARMKFTQIPRFIRWGRPVEKLVRDHPGSTLSLASIKFPNLVSTFSAWRSKDAMRAMVLGHSTIPQPERHIDAMKEREKKDFHFEFTTLRFRPLSEYGSWNGKSDLIPNFKIPR